MSTNPPRGGYPPLPREPALTGFDPRKKYVGPPRFVNVRCEISTDFSLTEQRIKELNLKSWQKR